MHRTSPKVFLVAETAANPLHLNQYLEAVGAPGWQSDAVSDAELLIEVMGRMCYRSFGAGLNPNVTKVREGNADYIANIIKVGHGSVLEHASASFIFHNVSRVFTHELVRHRAGTAMSQESLRFVRLTDLGLWLPSCIQNDPELVALFGKTFENLEQLQQEMAVKFNLDGEGVNFDFKKQATSAMRRLAPIGLSTSIGFTMNHRALRHILVMRTSRHAEEEIRVVFAEVGRVCKTEWPALYADFKVEEINGIEEYTTPHEKV